MQFIQLKRLTGLTNIDEALPETIREDFSPDTFEIANKSKLTIIHATDNSKESQKETDFGFSPDEIYSYKKLEEKVNYRVRKIILQNYFENYNIF